VGRPAGLPFALGLPRFVSFQKIKKTHIFTREKKLFLECQLYTHAHTSKKIGQSQQSSEFSYRPGQLPFMLGMKNVPFFANKNHKKLVSSHQ